MAKKICPTCEGEVKFDIIDGKCKACRLGVVPDWAKGAEKRHGDPPALGNCPKCNAPVYPLDDHVCKTSTR
jgi:hypothetical protein